MLRNGYELERGRGKKTRQGKSKARIEQNKLRKLPTSYKKTRKMQQDKDKVKTDKKLPTKKFYTLRSSIWHCVGSSQLRRFMFYSSLNQNLFVFFGIGTQKVRFEN